MIFMTLQAPILSSHGDLRRQCFSVQLVCLLTDFNHSKFQLRCVIAIAKLSDALYCRRHYTNNINFVKPRAYRA